MTFIRLLFVTIALQQYFDIEAFIRFGAIANRIPADNRYILEPLLANGRESNRENNNQSYERRNNNNNVNQNKNTAANMKPKSEASSKPKEQTHQMVQRTIPLTDRPPLSDFKVGQKCRGTIMSIVKHGFFIDIGTSKDGLAHVSDISKDYFIQNIMSKYSPGQQVDVWIKFVDPATSKLGLQMFPVTTTTTTTTTTTIPSSTGTTSVSPTTTATNTAIPIPFRKPAIFFPSESRINGTIVKVSDLGVFVDIGANVDAFLPKRKMKLSKKQMKFKPWEVHPLNSKMVGFVHEIDRSKNRISLTTYEPIDWPEKMPNKDYIISAQKSMVEDDEELGGSTRSSLSNARSLEKTLAMNIDDDDEEDNIFDAEGGEELSMEEINQLTGGKRKSQLLIDDDKSSNTKDINTNNNNEKEEIMKVHTDNNYEAEEEISTEELFNELRKSKPFLTYKEVKKWDYLQDFIDNQEINDVQIKELINECGGNGKLDVEQFDVFIDLLVDFLGLKEVDDDDYDENASDNEENTTTTTTNEIDDENDDGDDEEEEDDDFVILDDLEDSTFKSSSTPSMKTAIKAAAAESDSLFTHTISTSDEEQGSVDEVKELEQLVSMGTKGLGFGKSNSKANIDNNNNSNNANTMSLEEHFNKKSGTNDLLQYVFNDVAGKKGHVIIDDILKWDFTIALIEQTKNNQGENYVDEKKVRSIFSKLCTRKDGKADRVVFEKILDELSRIETLSSSSITDTTTTAATTVSSTSGTEAVASSILTIPKGTAILKSTNEFTKTKPEYIHKDATALNEITFNNNNNDDDDDDETFMDDADFELIGDEDTDEEYEEISIEDAFMEIAAPGEAFIKFESLCGWEMVSELIEDEIIDTDTLKRLFLEAGAKNGKLDLEGFNVLLDLLAPYGEDGDDVYDEDENDDDEEEEENDILMDDNAASSSSSGTSSSNSKSTTNKSSNSVTTTKSSTKSTNEQPIKPSSSSSSTKMLSPEEAESLDDDTILANVFQGLAGVKNHVSLKDLLNWDFVLDLFSEGLLDEETLQDTMKECGANKKGLNLEGFDRLVDSLVEMYGDADDDEDDEDNEDEEEMEVIKATTPGQIKSKQSSSSSTAAVVQEDDDDILDIDVAGSFATLSQGKAFITIPAFKKWQVITRLLDEGHLQSADIDAILTAADVDYKNKAIKMNLETFERVIDELANLFSSNDDDDDENNDDEEDDDDDDDNDNAFSEDDDTYEQDNQQLMKDLKAVIEKEANEEKKNSSDGKQGSATGKSKGSGNKK